MTNDVSSVRTKPRNKIKRVTLGMLLVYLLMLLLMLIIAVPALNLVAKSLSAPEAVSKMNGYQIWPSKFSLLHYRAIFNTTAIWRAFGNSLIITVCGTLLSVLMTCAAAYALTRPGLPGKKGIMVFLVTMMILSAPILQWYLVMKGYGLLNNLSSMILYSCVSVFNIILLMRFFEDTPQAILDAATVDGAGEWTRLFRIFIPLNKVAIITIALFYVVPKWNEYFASGVFLSEVNMRVLQSYLREFIVGGNSGDLGSADVYALFRDLNLTALQAATIVISVVPLLCLYPTILKYFTSGVLAGGVKE